MAVQAGDDGGLNEGNRNGEKKIKNHLGNRTGVRKRKEASQTSCLGSCMVGKAGGAG